MVAINFRKEFVQAVKSGKKRQTIRETTKAYTGCKLQLYYGQRTKQCKKLKDVICKSTEYIVFNHYSGHTASGPIEAKYQNSFARKDGFKNWDEFWKFFEDRAGEDGSFSGYLIKW